MDRAKGGGRVTASNRVDVRQRGNTELPGNNVQRVNGFGMACCASRSAYQGVGGNEEDTMTTADKVVELERVACEICLKEVPRSEATVPEATDYVAYFCGLDCYEKWKSQSGRTPGEPQKSGP